MPCHAIRHNHDSIHGKREVSVMTAAPEGCSASDMTVDAITVGQCMAAA